MKTGGIWPELYFADPLLYLNRFISKKKKEKKKKKRESIMAMLTLAKSER